MRTAGCPPCRRAPRRAPCRSRCRSPRRCGGRRPADRPCTRRRGPTRRACRAAAACGRRTGCRCRRSTPPTRRGSSSTVMSVSFVVRVDVRRATHRGVVSDQRQPRRLVRNRSTSCSAPGRDPQGVRHDRGQVAHEHAAIEQRLPHLLRVVRRRRHEQHEVRVAREDGRARDRVELADDAVALARGSRSSNDIASPRGAAPRCRRPGSSADM